MVTFAQRQREIAKQGSHPQLLLIDSQLNRMLGPYPGLPSRDSESVQYTVRGGSGLAGRKPAMQSGRDSVESNW